MKRFLFAVGMIVALASTASAAPRMDSAGKLRKKCDSFVNKPEIKTGDLLGADVVVDTAECVFFVDGWAAAVDGSIFRDEGNFLRARFVDGVETGQIIRVFVKYINSHPEYETKEAAYTLSLALIEAKLFIFTPVDSCPKARVQ